MYQRKYQATLLYTGYFRSRERFSTNPTYVFSNFCKSQQKQHEVYKSLPVYFLTFRQSTLNWSVSKSVRCCTPDISEAAKGFPQIPVVIWQANLQLVLRNTVGWFPISYQTLSDLIKYYDLSYFLNTVAAFTK